MTEEALERIPYLIYFGKKRLQKKEVWKIHRRTEFERVMEPCLQGDPEDSTSETLWEYTFLGRGLLYKERGRGRGRGRDRKEGWFSTGEEKSYWRLLFCFFALLFVF